MGLFPDSWKALVSGFPSLLHWNRYTKAVHLMRGQNGVRVFLQNGGAVIEGTGDISHPFKVVQSNVNKITITPGFCAAMGASDHVPTFADTTNPITDTPAEEKAITEDSLILLRVTYDSDEVWQSTSILIEDSAFNYTDTYTNGYLLIATVYWDTANSRIDRIVQGVTTSLSHSKCNIYHNWQATGQVPASLAGEFQPPQAASDPSGVSEGYLYYNTTDETYRYYDGAAWHTL